MTTQRQVGVSQTVEVPQIQFIVPFEDIPLSQQRQVCRSVMAAMEGFSAFLGFLSRSSRSFGVERQFFGALDGEEFFAVDGPFAQFIRLC